MARLTNNPGKARSSFIGKPAFWAISFQPRRSDKITRSIMREMRHLKFALKVELARLYVLKFALNLRSLRAKILRKIMQIF
jgi:hypothetical protein